MTFFEGFTWAIPYAFSDALASCQFEEGDTLYDNRLAYEPWEIAVKNINHSIQVTSPKRKQNITTAKQKASVFQNGWNSTVEFELTDYKNGGRTRQITTTQGRLYTLLWRGKFNILDPKTPPPTTLLISDAKKQLATIASNIDYIGKPSFLMAYDSTNPLLRKKRLDITEVLNKRFKSQMKSEKIKLSGKELAGMGTFLPTLSIIRFTLTGVDVEQMYDALKDVLYKPTKGKKTASENFRIEAHGILFPKIP